jgi:DNA-directed RNA polymerase subunit M/transcription elongation factor TFIIS
VSDLTFNCPHCSQELEAPEDLLGQTIECPSCNESIRLPDPELKVTSKKKIVVRKRPTSGSVRSTRPRSTPAMKKQVPSSSTNVGQVFTVIFSIVAAIGWAWWHFGGGYEQEIHQQAAQELRRIERDVAADSVKEYEIAKRNGSAMDAYVHAGMVCAAYLQANDEANYPKWKSVERAEGVRAGMPPELLQ